MASPNETLTVGIAGASGYAGQELVRLLEGHPAMRASVLQARSEPFDPIDPAALASCDVVFLGRPALANPHWPVWAARELGREDPFGLIPEDWSWWIRSRAGSAGSVGWPEVASRPSQPRPGWCTSHHACRPVSAGLWSLRVCAAAAAPPVCTR